MSEENFMAVASPCINVCQMDTRSGLCQGCFRSIDEIAAWAGATDVQRLAVLAAVEKRRSDAALRGEPLPSESDK